jgi:predicted aldo/keto reductase-like oxidoreductase
MEQGIIHHFGFSSHDPVEKLIGYIDSGIFESIIVNKNILDKGNDSAIDHAYKIGIGVLIMRPLYGGFLCSSLDCLNFMDHCNHYQNDRVAANIKYLLKNKKITSLLMGMNNKKEVVDNCNVLKDGSDDEDLVKIIDDGLETSCLRKLKICSGCAYCDFCPVHIPVSLLMKAYNFVNVQEKSVSTTNIIKRVIREYGINFQSYHGCLECKKCEKLCTSGIDIVNRIKILKLISESL